MSSVLSTGQSAGRLNHEWGRWVPIAIGLLALYLPTFIDLAQGPWGEEEQMHGPIVLAVVLWLIWQRREALLDRSGTPYIAWGSLLLIFGLLLYVLGRSQDVLLFEVGSLIPVLASVILMMNGAGTLRQFAFALFFILFMLPLPGVIVDSLTGPLKHNVSEIAESVLYAAGYPIARNGVVLSVGPYQLLVADACSGLHSLISMSAMGLLYIYLVGPRSIWRSAILAASLVPIAITANVIRVIVLVLVTYHFGDAAGQGFIHDFSGVFLFVVGLLLVFAIDGLIGRMRPTAKERLA